MAETDTELCREWAALYKQRGWNALPSRMDEKRPLVRFKEWLETPTPEDLFTKHPTTNCQIVLGRRWRLLAIDLDGPEASERFAKMGRAPRTWATISGGGGVHLWFTLPANLPQPLPKAFLWKGEENHSAIERLCDGSLLMAPPSIHPKTGQRYRFRSPAESPKSLGLPALCPSWILAAKPIEKPVAPSVPMVRPQAPRVVHAGRFDRRQVLDAIGDKVALAKSWGLRTAGPVASNGWVPCHSIHREDKNPSAGIHIETGTYAEPGAGVKLSLFDLSAELGVYADFRDAIADLGRVYRVAPMGVAS